MKKISLLFAAVAVMITLISCSKAEEKGESDNFGPQIENLQWGMSKEQIKELYECPEEESGNGLSSLFLGNPVELYGVPMEITLILDDNLGLFKVTGWAKETDYDKLEEKLEEKLSDYRTGAQPDKGVSWKSGVVREEYEKEELAKAYDKVLGEGVIDDTYLDGILLSPLVSYELKKMGGGCRLVIDAKVKEELIYILG